MNLPSQYLPAIGNASLSAGFLVILLLISRPWLRRIFGSPWVSAFWIVILIRLLVPWSIELPWKVAGLAPAVATVQEPATPWKVSALVEPDREDGLTSRTRGVAAPVREWVNQSGLLWAIWVLGAAGSLAYFTARAWSTASLARRAVASDDARLRRILDSLPGVLGRRADFRVTDEIPVAALVGVWRPRVLLPREWLSGLSDEQLRHVLLHELGHARRGDLVLQWLFVLAQCVHWFNPFVWLASRSARADAELACDAWVLARISEPEHESYGETLLKTSQLFRAHFPMSPIGIGMAASRNTLVVRVRQVGCYRPIGRWRRLLGAALTTGAAAILMTSRVTAQAPDQNPTAPAPDPAVTTAVAPAPEAASPVPPPVPAEARPAVSGPAAPPSPGRNGKSPPRPMIEIEARFFEVSEATSKKLGLGLAPGDPHSTIGGSTKQSVKSAPPPILVNGVLDARSFADLLGKLQETKEVDLLSAPRITVLSGQRAKIEIIREFRYPIAFERDKEKGIFVPTDFEARNLGITMEVDPLVENGLIELTLVPQVVELEGYVRANDGKPVPLRNGRSVGANLSIQAFAGITFPKDTVLQPVFSTRKMTTSVSVLSGTSILLGGMRRDDHLADKSPTSRILYILVTARLVEPQFVNVTGKSVDQSGPPTASSTPAAPTVSPAVDKAGPEDAAPVALPSEKPGYVLSPFAPKSGFIDVRGFPSGTKITCPYTGKIMRIP